MLQYKAAAAPWQRQCLVATAMTSAEAPRSTRDARCQQENLRVAGECRQEREWQALYLDHADALHSQDLRRDLPALSIIARWRASFGGDRQPRRSATH